MSKKCFVRDEHQVFFVKQKRTKSFLKKISTDKRTCCHVLRKEGKHEESELERVRERENTWR